MAKRKRPKKRLTQIPRKTTFGANVRSSRLEKGLNYPGLAAIAGVPRATIRQIENGRAVNPRLNTVVKLAKALGVTIGELVGLENPLEE